jgi:hypothetical protein
MKSSYQGTCTNCKKRLKRQQVFQGVVICDDCFKMISHVIKRTKKELSMLFLVYTDMLRVSLLKGEFNFSPAVDGEMPPVELAKALQQVAKKMEKKDGSATKGTDGEGAVPELQLDDDSADGEVRGGGDSEALCGRR